MTRPVALGDGIWSITAGSFPSNSYILSDGSAEGAVLIDVGLDEAAIIAGLQELGRTPSAIYCTHGHFDHVGSAASLQRRYDLDVFLHAADAKTAKANNLLLMLMKSSERVESPSFTFIEDGHSIPFRDDRLRFAHAPGHTPGSCVISWGHHLFTGDTLFSRGVGLAKTPGEDLAQLRRTILGLWDGLAGKSVNPGHGPSSTGDEVRRSNLALRAFLGMAEHGMTGLALGDWSGGSV